MKTIFIALFSFLSLAVLADGPVIQVSPFMKPVLEAQSSAGAQTALGFTGNTTLLVISNTSQQALAPATTYFTNSVNSLSNYVANSAFDYVQGLGCWFNAQQTLTATPSLTDGSTVGVVNFFGPLQIYNNVNGSSSVQFSSGGANGQPGFLFNNAELEVSNALVGISTFTISVTFVDFNGTNNEINYLIQGGQAGVNTPYAFRITPWEDGLIGSGDTGGSVGLYTSPGDGLVVSAGVLAQPGKIHTFVFNFDGSNDWCYLDGQLTRDTRLQPSTSIAGMLNLMTNIVIGGQIAGGANFKGVISDFRFYTNFLSAASCKGLIAYLDTQARIQLNTITVDGDSKGVGLHTTVVGATPSQFIGAAYPDWLVNTIGYSGRTIEQNFTNEQNWLAGKSQGRQVFFAYDGINNFKQLSGPQQVTEVPIALGWMTNRVTMLVSNGITPIICTLPSAQCETNAIVTSSYDWRANYNATIRTFTNLGAVVADLAAVPSIGTNGAYFDSCFVDGTHESALGYSTEWTIEQPLIAKQVTGIPPVFSGNLIQASATSGSTPSLYLQGAGPTSSDNTSISSLGVGPGTLANATNDNRSVGIGVNDFNQTPNASGSVAVGWNNFNLTTNTLSQDNAVGFGNFQVTNSDVNGGDNAVGAGNGNSETNGHGNTYIGQGNSSTGTGCNNILIGRSITESGSQMIDFGWPALDYVVHFIRASIVADKTMTATNGFASFAAGSPLVFGSAGCTNTSNINYELIDVSSSGAGFLSNTLTGWSAKLPGIGNAYHNYTLQPGMCLVGTGLAEATNAPF